MEAWLGIPVREPLILSRCSMSDPRAYGRSTKNAPRTERLCHCERSEAIQGSQAKAGLLRRGAHHRAGQRPDPLAPRNDGTRKPSSSRNGYAVVAGGAAQLARRLEGWPHRHSSLILRDARKGALLRTRTVGCSTTEGASPLRRFSGWHIRRRALRSFAAPGAEP
jgi:hypothetical protein